MGCDRAGGKERLDSKDFIVRSDAAANIYESGNMRPRRVRTEHGRQLLRSAHSDSLGPEETSTKSLCIQFFGECLDEEVDSNFICRFPDCDVACQT